MKRSRLKLVDVLAAAAILACFSLMFCGGCAQLKEKLAAPTPAYVQADRATHDAVAPDHLRYIDADATLTPEQRQRRHDLLDTWEKRIESGERSLPTPAVSTPAVSNSPSR